MMRFSLPTGRRRLVRLLGAGVLVTGGACMPVLLAAGSAQAATCAAAAGCAATGTLTMSAGSLSLTAPDNLAWGATLSGLDQFVVDGTGTEQAYTVDDATGGALGWNVSVSATTFTNGAATLPDGTTDAPTFLTNGDVSGITVGDPTPWATTTAPTAGCATGSTCSVPASATTYPVSLVTAAAAVGGVGGPALTIIYATATPSDTVGTGAGSVTIGSVGWWLNVPADAIPGPYVSTIVMEVASGP
jgi:hypothetical protein